MNSQRFQSDSLHSNSTSSPAEISIESKHFHYSLNGSSKESISLDQVIGFRHVNPKLLKSSTFIKPCCSSGSELELACSVLSQDPTGFWMVFCYEIKKNQRGDLVNPVFRRILFSCDQSSAVRLIDELNDALGYLTPLLKGTHPRSP